MISALPYQPDSIRSLRVLLGADVVQDAKCAYYGSALWRIVQLLTSGESNFPTWSDVFDRKPKPAKEETADEIKQRIVREMRR